MQPIFLDLAFGAAFAAFLVLEMIRVSQFQYRIISFENVVFHLICCLKWMLMVMLVLDLYFSYIYSFTHILNTVY